MPRGTTRLDGGVSRRSFLKLSIAMGGAAAIAASVPDTARAVEDGMTYPKKFTFAVMSDVHLFAPELWSDCPDYTTAENSDRKMFRESSDILDKALADVVAAKPDMVLVPGDLTKDGERACHTWVRDRFEATKAELAAAGADTQFYVINGNHDLNNHHGKDFSGGSAADAVRTDPLTYKSLWIEHGYTDTVVYDADGTADGSLSYVAHPCPGLTLIAVDTCKYNVAADDGTLAQETSGHISADLLAWVCDQAREARAAGDVVVAFQHHGIVPHFGYEPVIFGEYLVDEYETVAKAYAEAGISAVFTGHMHANDIAAATYGENTIYDIETGSLVTYPSRMRMGSLEFAQKGEKLECTLTVDSHDLGDVTLDECGLATTAGITAYGKERTLTVDSVQTMLGGMFVQPLLAQYAPLGIKAVLANVLSSVSDSFAGITGQTLASGLWQVICGVLPQAGGIEEGANKGLILSVVPSLNICIFYNTTTSRIEAWNVKEVSEDVPAESRAVAVLNVAEQEAVLAAVEPYAYGTSDTEALCLITQDSFAAFVDELAGEIDQKALTEDGQAKLVAIVDSLVKRLLSCAVDATPHSVLDLVDFAYQAHLMGCEAAEQWAAEATEAITSSGLLEQVVADSVSEELTDEDFRAFVESIQINLKTLLVKTSNFVGSILVIPAISGMVKNVGDLLDVLAEKAGIELGPLVGGMVPSISLFDQSVPQLAAGALTTLMNDTNVTEDHDFSLDATATLPSDPDGDEDVVDKSGLQAVVDQAEDLELAGASQAALDRYYAALAAALRLMSDPNATEAQVAEAEADLAAAIEAVKKSQTGAGEGGTGGNAGNGGSAGGFGKGDSSGSGALPKTGDSTNAVAVAVATTLGGAAIAAGVGVRAASGPEE